MVLEGRNGLSKITLLRCLCDDEARLSCAKIISSTQPLLLRSSSRLSQPGDEAREGGRELSSRS